MNIVSVMEELIDHLTLIDGLRLYDHVPDSIQTPCAIIVFPETMEFDATYGRGLDMMRVPVLVVVSKLTARLAPTELSDYASGSGVKSIKAALESGTTDPSVYHSLRVVGFRTEPIQYGGIDYLGATFEVEIAGSGG